MMISSEQFSIESNTFDSTFLWCLASYQASASDATPGYNTHIPEGLLTPDKYPGSTTSVLVQVLSALPLAPRPQSVVEPYVDRGVGATLGLHVVVFLRDLASYR